MIQKNKVGKGNETHKVGGDIQRMKVVFKERSERNEGASHICTGKKSSPERDNSRLKEFRADMLLECWRNSNEASVARW